MTRSTHTACWLLVSLSTFGQAPSQPAQPTGIPIPLNDLSAFVAPVPNWYIDGGARADLNKANALTTDKGTSVLVNIHPTKAPTSNQDALKYNLMTNLQHGDLDLELDYMVAPESKSAIYLQGRYAIGLADNWSSRPAAGSYNGSILERWNEKQTEPESGFEGHPARQNAGRAPGLWQHLKISFQAPRFTTNGPGGVSQKTENAKILRVDLNGVTIHENVELLGPTRASMVNNEVALGPLMFQGAYGAVAFKDIRYMSYDKLRPELVNLHYAVYKGKYDQEPDFGGIAPESEGPSPILSASVSRISNEFLIRYTGTLRVKEAGDYRFNLGAPGGRGILKINKQIVLGSSRSGSPGKITLPIGEVPFELLYAKFAEWAKPAIGLAMSGPGIREFVISATEVGDGRDVDPIIVDASTNTVLRSFMDLPGVEASAFNKATTSNRQSYRVTHAVSVGSPDQVHYTYDLDKGAVVQVWRGSFLDTTPMWHDRGDGSSRPLGMVQRMGLPVLFLTKLSSADASWSVDTTGSGYRPKGYILDESDRPTFRYSSYGSNVDDKIRVLDKGQGIHRDVTIQNPTANLYARLAGGTTMQAMGNGLYLIDGQSYLRVDNSGGATPVVRSVNGGQELVVPVKGGKLSYSILF